MELVLTNVQTGGRTRQKYSSPCGCCFHSHKGQRTDWPHGFGKKGSESTHPQSWRLEHGSLTATLPFFQLDRRFYLLIWVNYLQANLIKHNLTQNRTCTKFEDLRLWIRRTVPKEKENTVYVQLIITWEAFYIQCLVRYYYSSSHISSESQKL